MLDYSCVRQISILAVPLVGNGAPLVGGARSGEAIVHKSQGAVEAMRQLFGSTGASFASQREIAFTSGSPFSHAVNVIQPARQLTMCVAFAPMELWSYGAMVLWCAHPARRAV